MKKFSWLFFLCTFIVLIAPPGWAETTWTITQASIDQKVKIKPGEGDTITFNSTNNDKTLYLTEAFSIDITDVSGVKIEGNGVTLIGRSSDTAHTMVNRSEPVITISGDKAKGTQVTGLTFKNLSMSIKLKATGGAGISVVSVDDVVISDCVFVSNSIGYGQKAETSKHQYTGGAGIFVRDAQNIKVQSCDFEQNRIYYSFSGGNTEDGGGGIYTVAYTRNTSIDVVDCTFTSNDRPMSYNEDTPTGTTVNGSAGAIGNVVASNDNGLQLFAHIKGSTFKSNMAGRYGGAIYNLVDIWYKPTTPSSIDVTVEDSTFIGNKLEGVKNNGAFGGAIENYGFYCSIKINVANSFFEGNSATNAKINDGNNQHVGAGGGAICIDPNTNGSAEGIITGSVFKDNKANFGGALVNWGLSGKSKMTVKDCTFIGNEVIISGDGTSSYDFHPRNTKKNSQNQSLAGYPIGSAFLTRATRSASAGGENISGDASSTLINCTFIENRSVYGGTIASYKNNSISITDLYNCTFVNNKISTDYESNGVDLFAMGTNGIITAYNTIFYNASSDKLYMMGKNSENPIISLDHCAIPVVTTVSGSVTSDETVRISSLANASNPTEVSLNGVTHSVILLASSDDAKVKSGGTYYSTYSKDILGVPRSTTTPSMGAVEYVSFDIADTTTELTGKVGMTTTHKISSVDIDTNATYYWDISEDVKTLTGLTSLSVDADGVITVTPTASMDATSFTVKAVGTGVYEAYTATKTYTITVAATTLRVAISSDNLTVSAYTGFPKTVQLSATVSADYSGEYAELDDAKLTWEITTATDGMTLSEDGAFTVDTSTAQTATSVPIKVTATYDSGDAELTATATATVTVTVEAAPLPKLTVSPSTDITVTRSEALSVTITAVSGDGYNLKWLTDGTLPDGITSADSTDNTAVFTISGTVADSAALGTESFTVTASNDFGTESLKLNITVEDIAPAISSDSYSFSAPKGVEVSQDVTATSGTGITWALANGTSEVPSWITIEDRGKSAVIKATAPISEKAGAVYNIKVTATNSKGTASSDVTVTVTGSISGSDEEYTAGEVFASDATPVASTNAAGQPVATTSSVFRDGAGNIMLSMDIAITLESKEISAIVDESFDSHISVDVTYELAAYNYSEYVYFFGVKGLPAGIVIDMSGDFPVTSTDAIARGESGTKHYDFSLIGSPAVSADSAIVVSFDVYVSGDAPTMLASDYIEAVIAARTSYTETKGDDGITYTVEEVVDEATGELQLVIGSEGDSGGSLANALNSIIDGMIADGKTQAEIEEYFAERVVKPNNEITDIGALVSLPVKSLDLTEASNIENEELVLTGTSVTQVVMNENTSKTLTSLTLTDSNVKTVKASKSNLTTLTLTNAKELETVEVNETPVTALEATSCDKLQTIEASDCGSMETLTATNCPNLTTVTAERCDNTTEMTFTNCPELDTVTAAGNYNGDTDEPTGVKDVNFDNCPKLRHADFSFNRILRQALDGSRFPILERADFGAQHEKISRMSNRMNFATLFGRTLSVQVAEEDEAAEDDEIVISEEDAESFKRIKNIKAYDADGSEINATFDQATGLVVFDKTPVKFSYEYDMGAREGANAEFDATIIPAEAINPEDVPGPGEGSGSGGGCDAGFGLCAAAMALAAFFMKKR